MTAFLLLGVFSVCVAIGTPIGTSMCLASICTLFTTGMGFAMVPYNYYASLSKFLLLAIPFFILAGNIMEKAWCASSSPASLPLFPVPARRPSPRSVPLSSPP